MDSMYAKYVKERLGDEILETELGFATYRYLNNGKTVYIVDIYILPSHRRAGIARNFANLIAEKAKARGAKEMLGTVVPGAKNATDSLKVLLGYGMELQSASTEIIIFRKEL